MHQSSEEYSHLGCNAALFGGRKQSFQPLFTAGFFFLLNLWL
jgi:hypothetical protein